MTGKTISGTGTLSKGDLAITASRVPLDSRGHIWILLWSLLLGGVNVHLAGREPVVLYFDAILVLWLAFQVFWKGFFPSFSGGIMRLGIFCLLSGTLSAIVNYHDVYKSLAAIKVLACGLLVYAIARKAAPSILTLSLWGAVAGVLLLIDFQSIRYGDYEGAGGLKDAVGTVLGRSNYVASILLLLIPLAVAAVSIHKGKMRLLFGGCAMLMFAGMIVTMSRGAMLAMLLATILSLPLLYRAGVRGKHVLLALGSAALIVFLLPPELISASGALMAYRLESPDLGRQELMRASWESFKDNPVLGVGPGQLGRAIAHYVSVPEYDQQYMNAHNLVLNALAENGLIPGLGLLAMVGIVLRRAWRFATVHATALNVALWVALLGAVMHNMVEASFEGQQFQVVFWTVSAMVGMRHSNSPASTGSSAQGVGHSVC